MHTPLHMCLKTLSLWPLTLWALKNPLRKCRHLSDSLKNHAYLSHYWTYHNHAYLSHYWTYHNHAYLSHYWTYHNHAYLSHYWTYHNHAYLSHYWTYHNHAYLSHYWTYHNDKHTGIAKVSSLRTDRKNPTLTKALQMRKILDQAHGKLCSERNKKKSLREVGDKTHTYWFDWGLAGEPVVVGVRSLAQKPLLYRVNGVFKVIGFSLEKSVLSGVDVFYILWLSFGFVFIFRKKKEQKRLKYSSLWQLNFYPGHRELANRHWPPVKSSSFTKTALQKVPLRHKAKRTT